jgi:hypothetical protein
VNCIACKGACCETIELMLPVGSPFDTEWYAARGVIKKEADGYCITRFDQRCPKLTGEGLCSVHGTIEKPLACIEYEAGCDDCLETVRARRTRDQYAEIRDEDDPTVEELYGSHQHDNRRKRSR